MDREHAKLRKLFIAACDLPKAEQDKFVEAKCSDDPEIRRQLRVLLQNDQAKSFLVDGETAADVQFDFDTKVEKELPEHIGQYRVKEILGQGGMGVVYLAEQQNPRRDVAVKVIRSGMASQELLKRFELEATVLGRLKHPGIANIYEANVFVDVVTGQERPFLAMEYVEGDPLHEYIKKVNPGQRERLQLFVKICDAVNHAHQRGVIHRDLKPGNVMVKCEGQLSILDFGVARATEADPEATAQQTRVGQLIGTLPYMSPEQAKGNALDADTRSDVYALGLIAYELLSGKLPYVVDGADYLKSVRIISEQQPVPLAAVRPECRGDLDTIILKALEKEPNCRYQSANELAEDIQRHLDDKPIEARRIGWFERSWRWCRRNKSLAALAASVLALVLSVAVIASVSVVQLRAAAKRLEAESQVSNRRLFDSYIDQAKLRRLSHRPGQRLEAVKALENASALFPTLDWEPEEQATELVQLRSYTIGSLSTFDLREVKSWERPAGADKFQFDSNYQRYAVSTPDGTVRIFSVEDDRLINEFVGAGRPAWKLTFSPSGLYVVAKLHNVKLTQRPAIRVWNTITGELVIQDNGLHTGDYAFSQDDCKFAICRPREGVQVFSLECLEDPPIVLKSKFLPLGVHFRPGGAELICSNETNQSELWNLKDLSKRILKTEHSIYSVNWNLSGDKLAMGCNDGSIRIWDAGDYEKTPVKLIGHTSVVVQVDFSNTGEFLVSRAWDKTQRFWDVQRKTEVFRSDNNSMKYSGLKTRQNQLGFLHKERFGFGEFGFDSSFTSLKGSSVARNFDFHPTGRLIAIATKEGVELWDAKLNTIVAEFPIGRTFSAIFSPDGSRMYSSGKGGLRVWPLKFGSGENEIVRTESPTVLLTGKELTDTYVAHRTALGTYYKYDFEMERLSIDRTGRWLGIDGGRGAAIVLDLEENNQLHAFYGTVKGTFQGSVNYAEISPDGKWVVTTTWNGNGVWVWDTENGDVAPWLGQGGRKTSSPRKKLIEGHVTAIPAFSPSGESLAIATKTEVTIWEVGSWEVQQRFKREVNDRAGTVAFSPDGRLLVSAYDNRALQLRDVQSGERLAIFRVRGEDEIGKAQFSQDGSKLAAISRGSIVTWDLEAIQQRLDSMGIAWAK